MIKRTFAVFLSVLMSSITFFAAAQSVNEKPAPLAALQQQFVDLRFGMFIHFNIPTYADQDWPDPDTPASIVNAPKLNCDKWAKAAKMANMTYGCLTTKHHSGFCMWDTKTTDYNVMNSPLKTDVVKAFTDAFRKNGLKVMLYYSILDTHHRLRPNSITRKDIDMIKAQLTELLTNYGPITALIIDGWDAPWSRISYDDVPFEDIYHLVKRLQPNCLLMDLNGAKYPQQGLYYSDIKTFEMGAGQRLAKGERLMPALACLPLQSAWFWKTSFPATPVKDPVKLVNDFLIPLNKVDCNFILNVAPNRDGLMDDNALAALKKIGEIWHNKGPVTPLPPLDAPIISHNMAIHQQSESSWSEDDNIMDLANDDNFSTSWVSNHTVKHPWYEIDFDREKPFDAISIAETKSNISKYRLEYFSEGTWKTIFDGENIKPVKINRFNRVWGSKVRLWIEKSDTQPSIAEFGIYDERR